jgi:hypothetical protein
VCYFFVVKLVIESSEQRKREWASCFHLLDGSFTGLRVLLLTHSHHRSTTGEPRKARVLFLWGVFELTEQQNRMRCASVKQNNYTKKYCAVGTLIILQRAHTLTQKKKELIRRNWWHY